MAISVTRCDVEIVQHLRLVHQILFNRNRQLRQETGDDMPPCFLPLGEMQSLNRFFRALLRSEASPLMALGTLAISRLFEISLSLGKPVGSSIRHVKRNGLLAKPKM